MPKTRQKPAYQLHSATGRACVRIAGKDYYLGAYGSSKSRERYDDLISGWLTQQDATKLTLLVDDLCLLFLQHADNYYWRKDRTPTGDVANLRHALRFLVKVHGRWRIHEIGPIRLKQVRQAMIDGGLCRTNINRQIHRIRRVFSWGVENECVPAGLYQELLAVKALRAGRSGARESAPVVPVNEEGAARPRTAGSSDRDRNAAADAALS